MTPSARRPSGRPRWPYLGPPQRFILYAAFAILVGMALPWAVVLGTFLWASPLALTWILSAGLVTLAAGMVRQRVLVLLSATLGGGTAVVFALWQTARILSRCGLSLACTPGPGLAFLLAGGVVVLYQVGQLLADRRA